VESGASLPVESFSIVVPFAVPGLRGALLLGVIALLHFAVRMSEVRIHTRIQSIHLFDVTFGLLGDDEFAEIAFPSEIFCPGFPDERCDPGGITSISSSDWMSPKISSTYRIHATLTSVKSRSLRSRLGAMTQISISTSPRSNRADTSLTVCPEVSAVSSIREAGGSCR
jgi:hypothetical protein